MIRILATLHHLYRTFGPAGFRLGKQALYEYQEAWKEANVGTHLEHSDWIIFLGCLGHVDYSLPPHEVAWDYQDAAEIAKAKAGYFVKVSNPRSIGTISKETVDLYSLAGKVELCGHDFNEPPEYFTCATCGVSKMEIEIIADRRERMRAMVCKPKWDKFDRQRTV